jgi:hypothetical protein
MQAKILELRAKSLGKNTSTTSKGGNRKTKGADNKHSNVRISTIK